MVIKLEGGTDFDLTVLDQPDEDETENTKENKDKEKAKEKDGEKEEKGRKRKRDKTTEVTHILLIYHILLYIKIKNEFMKIEFCWPG